MANAAARFRQLLDASGTTVQALGELLDKSSHDERLEVIHSLGGVPAQEKVWEIAGQSPKATIADMVPPDTTPLREVIFHGKNSLPAFTLFQKRFCRPPKERGKDELWGYNHQAIGWLTGPGYFICHDDPKGAAVDYTMVPPQGAPGWPEVKPNERGLSFFIYRNMIDYMRRVSRHVYIGSAFRGGKDIHSYFLLCREG